MIDHRPPASILQALSPESEVHSRNLLGVQLLVANVTDDVVFDVRLCWVETENVDGLEESDGHLQRTVADTNVCPWTFFDYEVDHEFEGRERGAGGVDSLRIDAGSYSQKLVADLIEVISCDGLGQCDNEAVLSFVIGVVEIDFERGGRLSQDQGMLARLPLLRVGFVHLEWVYPL